jgi:formylglycine-generating enzyme required for sulfatase activity
VQAGVLLGELGDPRPGVCTLPPAMVRIEGGSLVVGITPQRAQEEGTVIEHWTLRHGSKERAAYAKTWPQFWINDQAVTLPAFEIARYTVTNAQYKLFLDNDGYNPSSPWWDEYGHMWLCRDDTTLGDVWHYRQRKNKHQPAWWEDSVFGIARPNHPVVGVSWYEATAFCRWLTQSRTYNPQGYVYRLPSEIEWEFAARGEAGRLYSWGDAELTAELANCIPPDHDDFLQGSYGATTAVGCFPKDCTPEGIYDLVGNVWEWTRSLNYSYPYLSDDGRESDQVASEDGILFRGSCWGDPTLMNPLTQRISRNPDVAQHVLGFRLVRYPPDHT